jgi:hypothetical protein
MATPAATRRCARPVFRVDPLESGPSSRRPCMRCPEKYQALADMSDGCRDLLLADRCEAYWRKRENLYPRRCRRSGPPQSADVHPRSTLRSTRHRALAGAEETMKVLKPLARR